MLQKKLLHSWCKANSGHSQKDNSWVPCHPPWLFSSSPPPLTKSPLNHYYHVHAHSCLEEKNAKEDSLGLLLGTPFVPKWIYQGTKPLLHQWISNQRSKGHHWDCSLGKRKTCCFVRLLGHWCSISKFLVVRFIRVNELQNLPLLSLIM